MTKSLSASSTLTDLHPTLWEEWNSDQPITGLRPQGSFLRNQPQLSRTPEYIRAYAPGDPVQLIDWRAYAREEQLLVRSHRNEVGDRIRLVLDVADSMFWPDEETLGTGQTPDAASRIVSKQELSMRLVLHLAYGFLKLGNIVEVLFLERVNVRESEQKDEKYRPRENAEASSSSAPTQRGRSDPNSDSYKARLLALPQASSVLSLYEEATAHQWQASFLVPFLRSLPEASDVFSGKRYRLHVVVSDGMNDIEDLLTIAESGSGRSLYFHVLSSFELEDYWLEAGVSYFDKQALTREMLGQELRSQSQLKQAVQSWCSSVEKRCHQKGLGYLLLHEKFAISEYLTGLGALLSDEAFGAGH